MPQTDRESNATSNQRKGSIQVIDINKLSNVPISVSKLLIVDLIILGNSDETFLVKIRDLIFCDEKTYLNI